MRRAQGARIHLRLLLRMASMVVGQLLLQVHRLEWLQPLLLPLLQVASIAVDRLCRLLLPRSPRLRLRPSFRSFRRLSDMEFGLWLVHRVEWLRPHLLLYPHG
jgi:hypothetical protein